MSVDKPVKEFVFRFYEKPLGKSQEEIAKIACLSCGLINPLKNNDVIPEILILLNNRVSEKRWVSSQDLREDIIFLRKGKSLKGTSYSNIRRCLKVLRDFGFVEKVRAKYRIKDFKSLDEVFDDILCNDVNKVFSRVKEYLKLV